MNHYKWLDENFPKFLKNLNINNINEESLIVAHGDKAESYKYTWEENNIHFYHGVTLYLLTRIYPYSEEVRQTPNGWVPVDRWVIENYSRFKDKLPEI